MITIQLKRSGGLLGKTLQATKEVKMEEGDLIRKLKAAKPAANSLARDDFYYQVIVNNKKKFEVDINLLKGTIGKLLEGMVGELRM